MSRNNHLRFEVFCKERPLIYLVPVQVAALGEKAEEQRSRGAEEQRSRGAEEQRSRGEKPRHLRLLLSTKEAREQGSYRATCGRGFEPSPVKVAASIPQALILRQIIFWRSRWDFSEMKYCVNNLSLLRINPGGKVTDDNFTLTVTSIDTQFLIFLGLS